GGARPGSAPAGAAPGLQPQHLPRGGGSGSRARPRPRAGGRAALRAALQGGRSPGVGLAREREEGAALVKDFIQFVFNGLSLGSIYALLALGFVVIFKATEVVNFAHGSILALGAYAISRFSFNSHINFYLSVLLGVAIAALLAFVIERGLVRTMAGRSVIAVSIM